MGYFTSLKCKHIKVISDVKFEPCPFRQRRGRYEWDTLHQTRFIAFHCNTILWLPIRVPRLIEHFTLISCT
jgi:hypothetical protein